jgi:anti-anti-sigma factor
VRERDLVPNSGDSVQIDVDQYDGDVTVVRVKGDVDLASADDLRAGLLARLSTARALVVDFDMVTFLGSAGLAVLIETDQRARDLNIRWALVADRLVTVRPLQITGLSEVLPVFRALPDAVAAVRAGG